MLPTESSPHHGGYITSELELLFFTSFRLQSTTILRPHNIFLRLYNKCYDLFYAGGNLFSLKIQLKPLILAKY